MIHLINFDAKFEAFVKKWYRKNAEKFTPDQMEARINEIYDEWAETPDDSIGASPLEYFAKITDAAELIEMLRNYCGAGVPVPNLLLDRIAEVKECEGYLVEILKGGELGKTGEACCGCGGHNGGNELKMFAVNLLAETDSAAGYDIYVDTIFDPNADKELREAMAEALANSPETVKETILKRIPSGDYSSDDWAAFVLVNCSADKRITKHLIEMFLLGEDAELYAIYLGKYGDADAIPHLYEAAKTCDYVTFTEIINALEELGESPEIERDFSSDATYKKVKRS